MDEHKCAKCGATFATQAELDKHNQEIHATEKQNQ